MEKALPEFLQYGAMGVLALGFVTLLVLFVRSDKRSELYARRLGEAEFDRTQLIKVVVESTKASTALAIQIGEQAKSTDRLNQSLRDGRCPLLTGNDAN